MDGMDGDDDARRVAHGHEHAHVHDEGVDEECGVAEEEPAPGDEQTKVGRRRQVIGILVSALPYPRLGSEG